MLHTNKVRSRFTNPLRQQMLGTVSVLAVALSASLAQAQTAQSGDVEQVVVTGSRIGTAGFSTPTPVTEISPLQYEVKQLATVTALERDIPSLTPTLNQGSDVDPGYSSFNLRNLGAIRTLTLVNGLRTQATAIDGTFDVNSLPASLVQHVDIVTGGASAAYGSDAVAGVVNITLNTTLQGFQAKVGAGESYYGDAETDTASFGWGTAFDGGRGHIVIGGDYFRSGELVQNQRPWGRRNWGNVATPGCVTITTTCTNIYITTGVVTGQMTDGGVITSAGPLQNIQFGIGGVLQPYAVGTLRGATYQVGGSGAEDNQTNTLQIGAGRSTALMHAEYDLTDDINVWTQLSYAKSSAYEPIIPNVDSGSIPITNQNAFLPAALQSMMAANKITSFVMGRTNADLGSEAYGHYYDTVLDQDWDPSAGAKGKFNAIGTDWSWDVNLQYSIHQNDVAAHQDRRKDLWNLSVDSLANPAVGGVAGVPVGQAVCRDTLTNPTDGCVPVNVFGPNTVSSAVIGYLMGTAWDHATMTMSDVSVNLKGQPFATWAGPVSMAVGGEYRRQTSNSVTDPYSKTFAWGVANEAAWKGVYSVEEGYLEFGVPLLKDTAVGKSLDLDAAVRATSYSTSGGVTTWKVGLNYAFNDDIRLRATRSHDIRAPDLQDIFTSAQVHCCTTILNPVTGANNVASFSTLGNPNLVPEIGDTITAGAIYSPSWLDGFNLSLDYWHIKLTNQIAAASFQQIVNNCLQFNMQSYCSGITYSPVNGQISLVTASGFNAASLQTDGWDLEAAYQFEMSDLLAGTSGTVQLHALATLLGNYTSNAFGIVTNTAGGVSSSLPRLRSNLNVIYLNDPWTISLTGNWEGGGPYNALYNTSKYTYAQGGRTINDNHVHGQFIVNISASYQVSDAWQIYGKVTNLFNVDPPVVPDTTPLQHAEGTNALFDRIGGQFLFGVKVNLN